MVLKVFADARQVDAHIDAEPAELVGRTDAGQHQQLGRFDRAATDDHLSAAVRRSGAAVLQVLDAHAAIVLDDQSGRARPRLQAHVAPRQSGLQIRGQDAAAAAILEIEMVPAAAEGRSVEVVHQGIAELDARGEKRLRHGVSGVLGIDDGDGALLSRRRIGVVELVFQPLEIRQAVLEGPAAATVIGPVVEIARPRAHMHHMVYERAAADAAASRRIDASIVQRRLGRAVVSPIELGEQQLVPAPGHLHRLRQVGAARLQHKDARTRQRAEAIHYGRAPRPRTDDDKIIPIRHVAPPPAASLLARPQRSRCQYRPASGLASRL